MRTPFSYYVLKGLVKDAKMSIHDMKPSYQVSQSLNNGNFIIGTSPSYLNSSFSKISFSPLLESDNSVGKESP